MRKVVKPWGHEEIWAETERYVGKHLHIMPGRRLSRQYHRVKDETVRVISGALILELGEGQQAESRTLLPGDSVHIPPGTVHRFCAGQDHVVLVEVSTPELSDVVRIQDDYDR